MHGGTRAYTHTCTRTQHHPNRARAARPQASQLLLRYPLLLTLATAQVEETCDFLLEELEFGSREELGELLGRHPELLLYGAPTLQVGPARRGPLRRLLSAGCAR